MSDSPIISACVTPEIKSEIEKIAADRGWSKSQVVARLLAKALRDLNEQATEGFTEVKL